MKTLSQNSPLSTYVRTIVVARSNPLLPGVVEFVPYRLDANIAQPLTAITYRGFSSYPEAFETAMRFSSGRWEHAVWCLESELWVSGPDAATDDEGNDFYEPLD